MTSCIRPILVIVWCVLAAPAWAGFDKEATRDMLVCLHSTNTADGLDFDRLQKAIATGANVNTTERVEGQTQTPLAKAVALKHLDAVLAMLRARADLNSHASDGPLRSPGCLRGGWPQQGCDRRDAGPGRPFPRPRCPGRKSAGCPFFQVRGR
jgi:hypothetical protein